MIRSFRHKGIRAFFETGSLKGVQAKHARRLGIILDFLDSAEQVSDMNFPGSNLHPLKGDRRGEWAVTVSGNWRITFSFAGGYAFDVDYEDYH